MLAEVFGDGYVIVIPTTDTLQRERDTLFVSEAATTFLISRSRTEAGKKLNRWIHIEVLPSIRKTGSYKVPEIQPPSVKEKIELAAYSIDLAFQGVPIRPELVAGIKLNAFCTIAPHQAAYLEPVRQELIYASATPDVLLTPTQIGERLGISGIEVNKRLIDAGLQIKNEQKKSRKDPSYSITDRGKEFATVTTAMGKAGDNTMYQQLRWYDSVIPLLQNK